MDGYYHGYDKENNSPSEQKISKFCHVRGPYNGQLSIGRRILASRQEVGIGRNLHAIGKGKKLSARHNNQVSLKDGKELIVGKGTFLSKVQTEDDVTGLILFPHQVAICIEEVYGSGHEKENEDGQLLIESIRQTVQWSRNAIHVIDNVALNCTLNTPVPEEFNFNEDILCMNRNKFDKRIQSLYEHVGGEESSVEISGEGVRACAKFNVFRVDGLAPSVPKRKYSSTKRIAKEKGERRIGSSRAQKILLANVERDLKSSLCSRGCLKKLNAGAILMKRFKAWRSNEYEERASWVLENLTEYYNEGNDKFETQLCD